MARRTLEEQSNCLPGQITGKSISSRRKSAWRRYHHQSQENHFAKPSQDTRTTDERREPKTQKSFQRSLKEMNLTILCHFSASVLPIPKLITLPYSFYGVPLSIEFCSSPMSKNFPGESDSFLGDCLALSSLIFLYLTGLICVDGSSAKASAYDNC